MQAPYTKANGNRLRHLFTTHKHAVPVDTLTNGVFMVRRVLRCCLSHQSSYIHGDDEKMTTNYAIQVYPAQQADPEVIKHCLFCYTWCRKLCDVTMTEDAGDLEKLRDSAIRELPLCVQKMLLVWVAWGKEAGDLPGLSPSKLEALENMFKSAQCHEAGRLCTASALPQASAQAQARVSPSQLLDTPFMPSMQLSAPCSEATLGESSSQAETCIAAGPGMSWVCWHLQ